MAGAILSYGLEQYGEMGDSALLIDTTFMEGQKSWKDISSSYRIRNRLKKYLALWECQTNDTENVVKVGMADLNIATEKLYSKQLDLGLVWA